MSTRRFRYRAVLADGGVVKDTITAASRADALDRLTRDQKTVLELNEAEGGADNRSVSTADACLALRQLAVMSRAGIDLLQALDSIAEAFAQRPLAAALRDASTVLRRGEGLATALSETAPFYPAYVVALVRAGEASGRLPQVLEEAARQMAFEQRVTRDIVNALVYPGFLVASGVASVGFLFYAVTPRFAAMLRNTNAEPGGLAAFVLNAGAAFREHFILIVVGLAAAAFASAVYARSSEGRRALSAVAHTVPGLRVLLRTRERATWSRIMAIALGAGVNVLDATLLAAGAAPEGPTKRGAAAAMTALRAGRPLDEAFRAADVLSVVDASLIRAGQRAGALAEMFRAVADRNDEDMRDVLRRFTAILEPLAIGFVAGMIGLIVLGLVSALAGLYETIG